MSNTQRFKCESLEPRLLDMEWAVRMGIQEAFICKQIMYWCAKNRQHNRNFRDGHYWTYNTYEDWHDQFPCFSIATIGRTLARLRRQGYIITAKYNESKYIHTLWYRLNPEFFDFDDSPPIIKEKLVYKKPRENLVTKYKFAYERSLDPVGRVSDKGSGG